MFSILVNTTDSYEDCWQPFFKLFSKYYPGYNGRIYLNTEKKEFKFDGLNIISVKNNLIGETWSKCLKYALETIEEEIILYLQEDYFFNGFINNDLINDYSLLIEQKKADCIHLTPFASNGPFNSSKHPGLLKYDKKAAYKMSLQASLWRKNYMDKYLKIHENAWQFEVFGTRRAWRNEEDIYIHNFNTNPISIIPYIPTGIIKGKWSKNAVYELFKMNEFKINYDERGFYNPHKDFHKRNITFKKIINRIKSFI